MSDIPVGCLDADDTGGPNGETYTLVVHGYDNANGWDVNYNNIRYNDNNRWHIQSYFEGLEMDPNGDGVQDFTYNGRYGNYRIETGNGGLSYFDNATPTEDMMAENTNNRFPADASTWFSVSAAYYPFFSGVTQALIEMGYSGGGSLSVDPYNYADWHVPLYPGLPRSQSSSHGVRFDVFSQADESDGVQNFDAEAEHGYIRVDGYGYDNFVTNTVSVSPYYVPLD